MMLVLAMRALPALRFAHRNARLEELVARLSSGSIVNLSKADIAEIAAEKTSGSQTRSRSLVLGNDDEKVSSCLVCAYTSTSPEGAIRALTQLKGVGVATASAVLCWTNPVLWPVVDIHSWDALTRLGLVENRTRPSFTAAQYGDYVRIVRPAALEMGWTPRDVDRWLYSFDRTELLPQHLGLESDKN